MTDTLRPPAVYWCPRCPGREFKGRGGINSHNAAHRRSDARSGATTKICAACGEAKSLAAFYRRSDDPTKLYSECKPCSGGRRTAWQRANPTLARESGKVYERRHPDRVRDSKLRNKYGLTAAQFDSLVESQRGLCRICKRRPRRLVVDHCHNTGRVRGLLCDRCNTALGWFGDDPDMLRTAIAYLEGSQ